MKLPGGGRLSFWEILRRLYADIDVSADYAAEVAYYLFYSLFPFLFFLTTLTAYLPLGSAVDEGMARMRTLLPAQAQPVVEQHLRNLVTHARPKLLTLGLLVAIWSASRAAAAIGTALNHAYQVKERRPYWKVQVTAIVVTVVGTLLVLTSIAVLIAGSDVGDWLAQRLGVGAIYHLVVQWLRWPVTAVVIMFVAALAYYFLPDVEQRFKFITPGSVLATILWMLATWGFGLYVAHFGSYNATYGSIGSVIVLLTWMYISGFIFLLGGQINAVLEHASKEGKSPGEHEA